MCGCVRVSRAHVEGHTRRWQTGQKRAKNLNWKMKVFPSSEQKSVDTSLVKHAPCAIETSLRIQIRHDSDNERESCISNRKDSFWIIFQFFKRQERTFSSSFDSRNAWKWKQAHYTKGIMCSFCHLAPLEGLFHKEEKKSRRGQAPPQNTCASRIAITRWREATRCFLLQTVLSTVGVCGSFPLLPCSWPPY